ncbi:MAG: ABC transporter ATP-binding protein, partial [Desulfovibrionales bacterium]
MISLKGVSCGYEGRTVLEDIDLELLCGEKAALIGPNGSGKTTLLQTISGCLPPISGELSLGDLDVSCMRPR